MGKSSRNWRATTTTTFRRTRRRNLTEKHLSCFPSQDAAPLSRQGELWRQSGRGRQPWSPRCNVLPTRSSNATDKNQTNNRANEVARAPDDADLSEVPGNFQ